jgi:hypothetical protein
MLVGVGLVIVGCVGSEPTSVPLVAEGPSFAKSAADEGTYSPALDALRQRLRASGVTHVELEQAEIFVDSSGHSAATTLIANNRTHTLSSWFVENDPRRGGSSSISYLVDQSDGSALSWAGAPPTGPVVVLSNAVTEAAIDRSMQRWEDQPRCNAPAVVKVPDSGADPDLIDGLVAGNPALVGTPFADITHAGWLPAGFFDAVAPGGASFILGVTFTFVFVDDAGNATDIDRNGRADVAFREIYYNRSFPWGTNPAQAFNVDIESVATHEAGHAYGLAHFGKVFIDNKGQIKYAPRAVMNAVYVSAFRDLVGTDNASFCQIWANGH